MYIILWAYNVRPGAEAAFETLYGPSGEWVALFQKADGFLGTELLVAANASRRYLTIDRWESEASYEQFRSAYAGAYEMIDRAAEGLTESETRLGEFRR
jgi:heme-degrading monooxygenase HmoA